MDLPPDYTEATNQAANDSELIFEGVCIWITDDFPLWGPN